MLPGLEVLTMCPNSLAVLRGGLQMHGSHTDVCCGLSSPAHAACG